MSYFDKLLIQGIRSFGPGENERQQVRFDSPLTIIVGRNGCGKTTIIESLRYVTCGEFPPGCKGGSQFVHDPKIANETETKAQIRLKFNDLASKSVSITRSMQVVQKAKKQEFKTVEGVISQLDGTGKAITSVSSKCADVDKEMAILLGVSKAVLNNVIFCHQEESNWPLDDPRQVKGRFDEIFAASRYIKAIDEFKKVKKHRNALAKQCQLESGYLKVNKDKFEELTGLCTKNETKLQDVKNRIDLVADEQKVNDKKLEEMKKKMQDVNEIISRKDSASISCEEKKYQIKNLTNNLKSAKSLFTGSDEDLEEIMEKHDNVNESRKEKERELANKIQETTRRIDTLTRKVDEHKTAVSEIRTKLALHQEDKKTLRVLMTSLADQLDIASKITIPSNESSVDDFSQHVSNEIETLNTKKSKEMKNFQLKEERAQKEIDKILLELNRVQDAIKRDSVEITNMDRQVTENAHLLEEIEQSGNRMKQLKTQISNMKAKLQQHEKTFDETESNAERAELKRNIQKQELALVKLGNELTTSSKANATMETVRHLRNTIDARKSANSRILSRRTGDLVHVLGEMPKKNLKATAGKVLTDKTLEFNEMSKILNAKNVELKGFEFKRKSFADSLREKEADKTRIEMKIDCSVSSYDNEIEKISSSIKELQDKIGCLKGSSTLYTQYCAKLQEPDPTCPVCFRGFEGKKCSSGNPQEAIDRLMELKNRIPSSVKSEEMKLQSREEKLKKMYDSRHLYMQHESLCKDIPQLKADVDKCGKEEAKLNEEVEDIQLQIDLFQSDISILNESMTDLAEYDRNDKDILEFTGNLAAEEEKLAAYGNFRSLEDVNLEKTKIEKDLNGLKTSLEKLNEQVDIYQKTKSKQQEEILTLERNLVDLSSKNQRADQISEKMKELSDKKKQLSTSVELNQTKIGPLEKQADTAKLQKASIVKDRENKLNEISGLHSKVVASFGQFEALKNKIKDFQNSDKSVKLERFENAMSDAETELKTCRNSLTAFQNELSTVKEELASEAIQKRVYEDNLNLRLLMQEHDKLDKLVSELEAKIASSQGPKFKAEYQSMIEMQDKLNREYYQATGQRDELISSIKDLKKQLDDPTYKDAQDKWVKMVTEWKTNKLASVDIDKFTKALDSALMRFHGMKMREINDILSQLWRDVYTGTDIDTIEIRTEEGENSTATRMTYNYRVVMVKQGVELDMRGRCSAGQKVLASLLIRLALAETFCLQCGVFSLDEPTTNLDRENINSLAEALVNLIRKRHKNSQFVIITHDMEFVELLGHAELVEYYHEVTRNDVTGLSVITRRNIREMESNN